MFKNLACINIQWQLLKSPYLGPEEILVPKLMQKISLKNLLNKSKVYIVSGKANNNTNCLLQYFKKID